MQIFKLTRIIENKPRFLTSLASFASAWKSNSKFTIHPFKSQQRKVLLPLSPLDYLNRFSLELVILGITAVAFLTNIAVANRANLLETKDQSVIFSYLRSNPQLNNPLLDSSDTTTILAKSDQWVAHASASSRSEIVLTSTKKNESSDPTTIQENVIVKTNPADTDNFLRSGKTVYEVVPGDTLMAIASSYGVSLATVIMENKLDETAILKPGQKLSILPTTGVSHTVGANDTLESIAGKYKVSEDDILDVNDLELPDDILAGDVLVIPLDQVNLPVRPTIVKDTSNKIAVKTAAAPDINIGALSFIWPTATRQISQGFHRRHSGLDISNSTQVAIYASEDGFVELSGWQTGYGNTIILNHGNGFKTRYAHASELYVSAGERVAQGQVIAKQGRTGRVRGVTGIHLHFEVIKNGVRVNPLSYVRP